MTSLLTIAEAAAASGLSAHTLRYYEQIGLIAPVGRQGGARRYSADDMRWLEFLVRLRTTGMPMKGMQRYAQLRLLGDTPESLAERQAMLVTHAGRVQDEVRKLGETLGQLRQKIITYDELLAAPPSRQRA